MGDEETLHDGGNKATRLEARVKQAQRDGKFHKFSLPPAT